MFNPYTGIKTNLLFFSKGQPTETIWYYEHPYPAGYKSYSKTKPIRLDEFQVEKDWWGKESNHFADRMESENAWKVDFKAIKAEAEAKAQPHWQQAEALTLQASQLDNNIKDLRDSIKGSKVDTERQAVDEQIEALKQQAETLRIKLKTSRPPATAYSGRFTTWMPKTPMRRKRKATTPTCC